MDETLRVYADSTSPNGMCIMDATGKFSALGFKLCEAGNINISDDNGQNSASPVNSDAGGISATSSINSGAAGVNASSSAATITVAAKAHAKLLADESVRLDAQQQAVKRLLAARTYMREMGQAKLKRVQDQQANLTNKLAASIASQRSKTEQILANSQMQQNTICLRNGENKSVSPIARGFDCHIKSPCAG